MIYNKVATAYYYKSSSHTLSQDTYYKLTFSVKTLNISAKDEGDDYGAYVYVSGDAYVAFQAIDTDGDWVEYTVYFRGSNKEDCSITLSLGLGDGNYSTGNMTKGWAFFDNVVLTDLTNVDDESSAYTDEEFDALVESETIRKYDLSYADANFNAVSSSSTIPYSAAQYTGAAGTGSGSSSSTSSSYLEKGIMDISAAGGTYTFSTDLATHISEELTSAPSSSAYAGDRMLYIYNKKSSVIYTNISVKILVCLYFL